MASARWVKCQLGWTGASGASLRGISGGVVPSQSSNRTLYRGPYEAKRQDQAEYIILEVRVRRRVHGVDDFYVHLEQQKQWFQRSLYLVLSMYSTEWSLFTSYGYRTPSLFWYSCQKRQELSWFRDLCKKREESVSKNVVKPTVFNTFYNNENADVHFIQ